MVLKKKIDENDFLFLQNQGRVSASLCFRHSDTSALPENSTVNFQKDILTKAWLPVSAMIIYRSIPNIQIVLTYFCKSFAIEWVTKICEFFACGLWI